MWGSLLKVALGLLAVSVVSYGGYKIYQKISESQIRKQARQLNNKAFIAMIKSKNTKRVDVGLFDREKEEIGAFSLESNQGVERNLYVGQKIYL